MNPRISFGQDFLFLMRSLELSGSDNKGFDPIADAACRLFLLMWGLSAEEVDQANVSFWEAARGHALGQFKEVFERLVTHVKKDRQALERLVIQCAAVATLDFNMTPDEAKFIRLFQDYLDLKPSELESLVRQGANWAIGLAYFGGVYTEHKKK